jgi:hypothetical protein
MAACGDDEGAKASGSTTTPGSGDGGTAGIDLSGLWVTTDFECRSSKRREVLQVDQRDLNVSGTKVVGDDCVPAGYVSFEGKLPRAEISPSALPVSFPVKLYGGDPGAPDTIGISDSGMGKITSPNSISLQLSRSTIVLTRMQELPAAGGGGGGGSAPVAGKSGSAGVSSHAGMGGSGEAGEPVEEAGAGAGGGGGSGGAPSGRASARGGAGGHSGAGGAGSGGRPAAGSGGRGGAGAGGMSEEGGSGGAGAAGGAAANCRGPLLPGATCDHVQQCGCKADETCQFYGAEPPRCQPAGPQANGELCETNLDCGAGLLCVNRICRHNCREDSDCSGTCNDATYDDMEVQGLKFCLDPCNPVLTRDCTSPTSGCGPCAQGSTCLPSDEGFAYCIAPDLVLDRDPGERCTNDEECFGGGCQQGICRRWCQTNRDCQDTEVCMFGTGQYIKQGVELGYCDPR